ncbi:hypothetical protein Micbo1qcDRAFT_201555 [Microdochium bolleyi]|uniref:TNT domain-containing protein n=1 Tax=Microdochium bolleyi TaxID=196109 RepID=A0A136JGH2_9PEZI|nr:hypothetical protein Micbo1qcDRAFT_201555 [Microdochium bolleyi]
MVKVAPGDFPEPPKTLSVSALLQGYEQRPGNITKEQFVERFCDRSTGKDLWQYPNPSIGSFISDYTGTAIKFKITLGPGTLIDRFGGDDTRYFAPLGTPYAMRSLPPCVLGIPSTYSVYRVLQPLEVEAGPIAPGFLQPGLGTQYVALQKSDADKVSATTLMQAGVIEKLSDGEVLKMYQH